MRAAIEGGGQAVAGKKGDDELNNTRITLRKRRDACPFFAEKRGDTATMTPTRSCAQTHVPGTTSGREEEGKTRRMGRHCIVSPQLEHGVCTPTAVMRMQCAWARAALLDPSPLCVRVCVRVCACVCDRTSASLGKASTFASAKKPRPLTTCVIADGAARRANGGGGGLARFDAGVQVTRHCEEEREEEESNHNKEQQGVREGVSPSFLTFIVSQRDRYLSPLIGQEAARNIPSPAALFKTKALFSTSGGNVARRRVTLPLAIPSLSSLSLSPPFPLPHSLSPRCLAMAAGETVRVGIGRPRLTPLLQELPHLRSARLTLRHSSGAKAAAAAAAAAQHSTAAAAAAAAAQHSEERQQREQSPTRRAQGQDEATAHHQAAAAAAAAAAASSHGLGARSPSAAAARQERAAAARRAGTACKYYAQGRCDKGAGCAFAHAGVHVQRRADLCKHFLAGKCARGEGCLYSHEPALFPCRFHFSGRGCGRGAACVFSHSEQLTEAQRAWLRADLQAAGLDPPRLPEKAPVASASISASAAEADVGRLFSATEDEAGAEVELGDISTRKAAPVVPRGSARSKAWTAAALAAEHGGATLAQHAQEADGEGGHGQDAETQGQ